MAIFPRESAGRPQDILFWNSWNRVFYWKDVLKYFHPINSVKALKETQSTNPD